MYNVCWYITHVELISVSMFYDLKYESNKDMRASYENNKEMCNRNAMHILFMMSFSF